MHDGGITNFCIDNFLFNVIDLKWLYMKVEGVQGSCHQGSRNFPTGADSSNEGAKIWFSGYYKCQKSPKKSPFTFRRGLACSDGGYIPLALPWRHPLLSMEGLSCKPVYVRYQLCMSFPRQLHCPPPHFFIKFSLFHYFCSAFIFDLRMLQQYNRVPK